MIATHMAGNNSIPDVVHLNAISSYARKSAHYASIDPASNVSTDGTRTNSFASAKGTK
jgi:hypothetical protein